MKRHEDEIGLEKAQYVSKARSQVSEKDIRMWFSRTEEILQKDNYLEVLSDPSRVFNTDETAVYLNP